MLEDIKNHLIVSCQALEYEPLHSSFIMSKMALAAYQGGAKGIRANTIEDIQAIKKEVDLPIIGIIKQEYEGSVVFITPTIKEVDALVKEGVDIIAMDATIRERPHHIYLDDFFKEVRKKYPNQKFMADCSTIEEAIHADELGFDFIGTTMVGYTKESKGLKIEENDFEIIRTIIQKVKRVLELGCYSVVVGSIITRPQLITKRFTDIMEA